MSLHHKIVNPLNVHGLRRLEFCPPHFTTVVFDLRTQEKNVSDWIFENLEGRFYYGDWYHKNPTTNKNEMSKCVAFETAHEASYFTLQLQEINKSEASW
jgi:hypothetical protein